VDNFVRNHWPTWPGIRNRLSWTVTLYLEMLVSKRHLEAPERAMLDRILALKGQIADLDAKTAEAAREAADIATDQARLRENITAVSKRAKAKSLIARYLAKAGEQETRLVTLATERGQRSAERRRLQSELDPDTRAGSRNPTRFGEASSLSYCG